MIIAVAVWNQRVAPVFDNAREILLAEVSGGTIEAPRREMLTGALTVQKVLRLVELGVETLICGAISRPVQAMAAGYGIRVIPFAAGEPLAVVQAWSQGRPDGETYGMPGCRRTRRLESRNNGAFRKESVRMNKGNQQERGAAGCSRGQGGGRGAGGRGMGGRGQGGGRRSGPAGDGPADQSGIFCVCPQCGQRHPHERGLPCVAQKCPQCGGAMTRG